jgi:hypothetical protein
LKKTRNTVKLQRQFCEYFCEFYHRGGSDGVEKLLCQLPFVKGKKEKIHRFLSVYDICTKFFQNWGKGSFLD